MTPETLADEVRRQLPSGSGPVDVCDLATLVRRRAGAAGTGDIWETVGRLASEVMGAGPLEALLADPEISDVLVNGPGPVWVDRGRGVEPSGLELTDDAEIRRLAVRLVAACGRRLDDAAPCADARLGDGSRVHAVLPPISSQGTCLSIRVPPRRTFTLDRLVDLGAVTPAGAQLLRQIVRSRVAFVVVGGTGSGKTSVLSALLSEADPRDRIVLVEDAAELRPALPHVVRLESRLANAEGAGALGLDVLVRQAMRMRPDRLVVGEVRGAEVVDLLSALNTGHAGGASTVHANRAEHVPARFEALAAAAGLAREATHAQLAAGLDVVVALTRDGTGRRQLSEIGVVRRVEGEVRVEPAYAFANGQARALVGAAQLDRRLAGAACS
jgi:pilus assembly protein CpaF